MTNQDSYIKVKATRVVELCEVVLKRIKDKRDKEDYEFLMRKSQEYNQSLWSRLLGRELLTIEQVKSKYAGGYCKMRGMWAVFEVYPSSSNFYQYEAAQRLLNAAQEAGDGDVWLSTTDLEWIR